MKNKPYLLVEQDGCQEGWHQLQEYYPIILESKELKYQTCQCCNCYLKVSKNKRTERI